MKKFSVLIILAIVLVLGLVFMACDDGTTNGGDKGGGTTLSGTYLCQAPSHAGAYITFWTNGTCEVRKYVTLGTIQEGVYSVSGSLIMISFTGDINDWTDEWTILDANTLRDHENSYIWKK